VGGYPSCTYLSRGKGTAGLGWRARWCPSRSRQSPSPPTRPGSSRSHTPTPQRPPPTHVPAKVEREKGENCDCHACIGKYSHPSFPSFLPSPSLPPSLPRPASPSSLARAQIPPRPTTPIPPQTDWGATTTCPNPRTYRCRPHHPRHQQHGRHCGGC
jgi:hypothetical protein